MEPSELITICSNKDVFITGSFLEIPSFKFQYIPNLIISKVLKNT
tara:strand:+ start:738 stop:872 length:135 start_codon:yes stop_codon:yes gene_type:complete